MEELRSGPPVPGDGGGSAHVAHHTGSRQGKGPDLGAQVSFHSCALPTGHSLQGADGNSISLN